MKQTELDIPLGNSQKLIGQVLSALKKDKVNLKGLSLSGQENSHGVLRIVVSDVKKAKNILMERRISAVTGEVLVVELDDIPGAFCSLVAKVQAEAISLKYAYACSEAYAGKAIMVCRFSDNDEAIKIIRANGYRLVNFEESRKLEVVDLKEAI